MSLAALSYDSGLSPHVGTDTWERLELTSRDPCRTDVVDTRDSRGVIYRVKTDELGAKPITTYTDVSGNIIATLEWHLYLSDKLSVRGRPNENVGKWLKSKRGSNGRAASFTDESGRSYSWQNVEDGLGIHLFADGGNSSPIAMFTPAKGSFSDPSAPRGTIVLSNRASSIHDEAVLSALLLEKARRFSGRESVFSSDAAGHGIASLFLQPLAGSY